MPDRGEELLTLAGVAELVDISYELITAEAHSAPEREGSAPEFALSIRLSDTEEPNAGGNRHLQYGLRVTVETTRGRVVVEPVATYTVPAEREVLLQQPTLTEFANEVAVMALIPYARQSLQDLAARVLREQIVMPSFPRGAITFPPPPTPIPGPDAPLV